MAKDEKIIRVYYADEPAKTFSKCPRSQMQRSLIKKKSKFNNPLRVYIDGKADPRNRTFMDFDDIRDTFEALQKEGFYVGYKIVFPIGKSNTYEE